MPPACAMAMAIWYSVTVSIAEATIGILRLISRVIWVRTSTSEGSTSDRPGLSSTSSKVNASGMDESIFGAMPIRSAQAWAFAGLARCGHLRARQIGNKRRLCEGLLPRPIRRPAYGLAMVGSTAHAKCIGHPGLFTRLTTAKSLGQHVKLG